MTRGKFRHLRENDPRDTAAEIDNITISRYFDPVMPRRKPDGSTRQIYASVREELYLAAKARATELRIPLREFIEMALEGALLPGQEASGETPSIWGDEYLEMQARQAVGSPVELTPEEAERVVKATFGVDPTLGPAKEETPGSSGIGEPRPQPNG